MENAHQTNLQIYLSYESGNLFECCGEQVVSSKQVARIFTLTNRSFSSILKFSFDFHGKLSRKIMYHQCGALEPRYSLHRPI